jgi:hypothetical protein
LEETVSTFVIFSTKEKVERRNCQKLRTFSRLQRHEIKTATMSPHQRLLWNAMTVKVEARNIKVSPKYPHGRSKRI